MVASCVLIGRSSGFAWLLLDDVHHAVLERLFVLRQSVLLPCVVEDAAIHVMPLQAALEKAHARPVVRLLLELECTAVLHELTELRGVTAAQLLQRRLDLLFLDVVVLFILRSSGKTLPWQLTFDEVEEHVANCFQVISSRLLNSLVGRYRRISSCSGQIFAIFVWDMLALTILIALGQAEIYDVDIVSARFCATNQEIVWLDIPMDDPLLVYFLDALDQLNGDHEYCFQIEVALARLEKILEGWAEQVHHHDMELLVRHRAIRADVVEAGHACLSSHLVDQL